jgi:pimeloyl-ACP methyl ester carboxylesterase
MPRRPLFALSLLCLLCLNCGYVRFMFERWEAERVQEEYPSLANTKRVAPEKCLMVYGMVSGDVGDKPLAVVALSDSFGKLEVVDVYQLGRPGYFTLYLPEGRYRIVALADLDADSQFGAGECVGRYRGGEWTRICPAWTGLKVVKGINIAVSDSAVDSVAIAAVLPLLPVGESRRSEFYPPGSLRSLDDTIFSPQNARLGMYDPPAFLARAGIYFYALAERDLGKTPIVFVHGIGGTPRDFRYVLEHIDRSRFDPWLFYYPSGENLDKIADVFAEIFFSGNIIRMRRRTLIVVAHSMGGLVVREAINHYNGDDHDRFLRLYVSLCTPYGGNADAAAGVSSAPVVPASWRDIAEGSGFLKKLYARPIPGHVDFRLFFAFRNSGGGGSSDGTIALRSQLDPRAQFAARATYGYDETHTSILESPAMMERLNQILAEY